MDGQVVHCWVPFDEPFWKGVALRTKPTPLTLRIMGHSFDPSIWSADTEFRECSIITGVFNLPLLR